MIPSRTIDEVVRQFGDDGSAWLEFLPQKLQRLSEQWGLELEAPFAGGLAQNLVIPCSRGEEQLVLKLGYPQPELQNEITMLEYWQSATAGNDPKAHKRVHKRVQLVRADREAYAFLMERVSPGTTFRDTALAERSITMPDLFDSVPLRMSGADHLPHYRDWCEQAFEQFAQQPSGVIDGFQTDINLAALILDEVVAAADDTWILHGDLHHENMVLGSHGDYVAIDPKGVKGPKILEYGRFIHNFTSDEPRDTATTIKLRLENLAKRSSLESDGGALLERQLLRVGYLDLVLSLTWTLNSGGRYQNNAVEVLRCMAQMLR